MVESWARIAEQPLVKRYGNVMRHDGLDPEAAERALDTLKALDEREVALALDAAQVSGVSLANLDVWARLMLREARAEPPGRRRTWPRRWTLLARFYISALDGDQRMAAWAAAAHMSVEELRDMESRSGLSEETLRAQAALAWMGDSDSPPLPPLAH